MTFKRLVTIMLSAAALAWIGFAIAPSVNAMHEDENVPLKPEMFKSEVSTVICSKEGQKDQFLHLLEVKWNETVKVEAFNSVEKLYIVMTATPNWETFTVLSVDLNGRTCIVAAGENAVFRGMPKGTPGV